MFLHFSSICLENQDFDEKMRYNWNYHQAASLECEPTRWAAKPTLMVPTMNENTKCVHFQPNLYNFPNAVSQIFYDKSTLRFDFNHEYE